MKKPTLLIISVLLWFTLSNVVPMGIAFTEQYPQGTFTRVIQAKSLTSFAFDDKKDFQLNMDFQSNSSVSIILQTEHEQNISADYFKGVKGVDFVSAKYNVSNYQMNLKVSDNGGYYIIISNEQFDHPVSITVSTTISELSTNAIYFGIACTAIVIGLVAYFFISRRKQKNPVEEQPKENIE